MASWCYTVQGLQSKSVRDFYWKPFIVMSVPQPDSKESTGLVPLYNCIWKCASGGDPARSESQRCYSLLQERNHLKAGGKRCSLTIPNCAHELVKYRSIVRTNCFAQRRVNKKIQDGTFEISVRPPDPDTTFVFKHVFTN